MPPPTKQNTATSGKEIDDEDVPSHCLWVGNLSSDTVDSDLMDIFAKYGALDSVTTYSSRSYAFVYFKHLDDARAAKEALQDHVIHGNAIRIEFARPARPGKHLWVGAISSAVTKEQLEDEFLKFGKIEEFKFLRDRNSALVGYYKLEDASAALKNMNGKRLGGEQIRVDFLRSQPSRKDNWPDYHEPRDGHFNNKRDRGHPESFWMPPDATRNFPESSQFGPRRHPSSQTPGGRREGQPSNILWIGYPPSVQIDEQMLHNAMILFGEIERIKSFPSRHYSFVEFRSIDEARRAKEGLQGRLFNDPRIQIEYSSSELAPGKDSPGFFPTIRGPRPEMLFNEPPYGPGPPEFYGHPRPMGPNNFVGPPPNGMPRPNVLMRPFGPQGFDSFLSGPEYSDSAGFHHNYPDANAMAPNWRRLSPPPAPGMLTSPGQGIRPPMRPMPGMWDGFDANPFHRDPKRSRVDGLPSIDDSPFHARKMDNRGVGDPFSASGPLANVQVQIHRSPMDLRGHSVDRSGHVEHQSLPLKDYCWRGVIAKGGTPVCNARCVPIGRGIESQLPEVVNCSARTGLDMLTKHYAEASGFGVVFFLPDSEEDFASYTEFLRYLAAKNRAGVAKLDDGTTLFLVPPSDFLFKVLNVSGPERLYGVVLKLPHQPASAAEQQLHQSIPPPSQYIDRQRLPPPLSASYNFASQNEDQVLPVDYNRVFPEEPQPHAEGAKPLVGQTDQSRLMQSLPPDYGSNPAAQPQGGVSLTPELISALAALIPANTQSPASTAAQLGSSSSAAPASFPNSVTPDTLVPSQGWRQEHQVTRSVAPQNLREDQMNLQSQQFGHLPFSQVHGYTNVATGPENSGQIAAGGPQVQDPALNIQQPAFPSRPMGNFGLPLQGGQFTVPQANQQYQLDASQNYGMAHPMEAAGVFHLSVPQQTKPIASSAQAPNGNIAQLQMGMQQMADQAHEGFPNQVQQLQSVFSAPVQGTSDSEVDKNQRYQSTIQFAASLLRQIQQQ